MNWKLRLLSLVVVGGSLGLLSGCEAKKKPDTETPAPASNPEAPAAPAQAPSHTTDTK